LIVVPSGRDPDPRLIGALEGLTELRAGRAGRLRLEPTAASRDDQLLGRARGWRTITPYRVNRHARRGDAAAAVADDVRASCGSAGLPRPEGVEVSNVRGLPGAGVEAMVELTFATAQEGPLMLGRTRHLGGGVFEVV
jgi:CRISPR-associated protein Csb2